MLSSSVVELKKFECIPIDTLQLTPIQPNSRTLVSQTLFTCSELEPMKETSFPLIIGNKKLIKTDFSIDSINTDKLEITSTPSKFTLPGLHACTVVITVQPFTTVETDIPLNIQYKYLGTVKKAPIQLELQTKKSHFLDLTECEMSEIGKGSYSVVYKTIWDGKVVAVKTNTDFNGKIDDFTKEAAVLQSLDCLFCIDFYGCSFLNETFCLIYEFAPYGSFQNVITESYEFNKLVMNNVANGLKYIHDHDIIHFDLKPENVLLFSKTLGSPIVAKISDFGTSKALNVGSKRKQIGTPTYMAPEIIMKKRNFGMMMYQACSLKEHIYDPGMFEYQWDVYDFVSKGKRFDRDPIITSEDWIIIEKCWCQDPKSRLTSTELVIELECSSFTEINLGKILEAITKTMNVSKLKKSKTFLEIVKRMVPAQEEQINSIESNITTLNMLKVVEKYKDMILHGDIAIVALLADFLLFTDHIDEAKKLLKETQNDICCSFVYAKELIMGNKFEQDAEKGFKVMSALAESGLNECNFILAECYARGLGTDYNPEKAFEILTNLSEKGYQQADVEIGWYLFEGFGVNENKTKAELCFTESALKQIPRGYTGLGACYYVNDPTKAKTYFEKAKDDLDAMVYLGLLEKSKKKRAHLFEAAAMRGNLAGVYNLGVCYEIGCGVSKDLNEAADLMKSSVFGGFYNGMRHLCWLYYKLGIENELQNVLLQESARLGDPISVFLTGKGFTMNNKNGVNEQNTPNGGMSSPTLSDKNKNWKFKDLIEETTKMVTGTAFHIQNAVDGFAVPICIPLKPFDFESLKKDE
ncbi:hypothetical protein QTN25_001308 [Entamoeba marina]